jgi:predicted phage terminase large subunit-like protein
MKLTSEDYALIGERLRANFSLEQLEDLEWSDRPVTDQTVRDLAEFDLEFFCRFYLSHHFTKPFSPPHLELFEDLRRLIEDPDVENMAIAMPRGSGKTTIVSNAFPLWCILFKKRRYIIIMQESYDQAKGQLGTIKAELTDNERIKEHFGNLMGNRWSEDSIEVSTKILVEALGAGSKIRGRKYRNQRPDLMILDDMENLESVQSETQRLKDRQRLYNSILPAGERHRTKVLMVGNFLHHDCLLKHAVNNPMFRSRMYRAVPKVGETFAFAPSGLWEEWARLFTERDPDARERARVFFMAHEAEMLAGAQVSFPSVYSYYDLMEIRYSSGSEAFYTEYLNEPRNPEDTYFRYETFKWQVVETNGKYLQVMVPWKDGKASGRKPWPLEACQVFAATDPSMGQSDTADPSAILVGAVAPDGRIFVLVADIQRRTPYQIMETQNAYAKEYPVAKWGMETNQFQAFFKETSAESSMAAGIYIDFTPIKSTANKVLRMNSLQMPLENAYILIAEDGQDVLKEQLDQYPNGSKVDGIDALEMLYSLVKANAEPENASHIEVTMHTFLEPPPPKDPGFDEWKAWLVQREKGEEPEMPDTPYPVVFV